MAASNSYSVGGRRLHVSREDGDKATGAGGAELRRGDSSWRPTGARRASPYGSKRARRGPDRPLANGGMSAAGSGTPSGGPGRRSRPSTGATGRGRTGRPISSFTTRPRRRTSRRRRSWRRCGRSTASIAAARSAPGCTGSWSTGRSTGRAPARCAARPRWSRSRTAQRPVARRDPRAGAQPALLGERRRRPCHCSRPSTGRSSSSGTCSSTRRARSPRRSSFPGERSTRACAGRSTGSARLLKEER